MTGDTLYAVQPTAEPGTEALRVPPHSIPAEQAVLGGLMLDNEAWDRVADRVTEEDFYRRDHRLIFRAIQELAEARKPFDAVTLSEWLDNAGQLADAGGMAYLGEIAHNTPSAANIATYAGIVRDKAMERRLVQVAARIGEIAHGAGETAEKIDEAQALVMAVAEQGRRAGTGPRAARDLVPGVIEVLDERAAAGGTIHGLPTGWIDLDRQTAGLHPGDLVIVAGRPSMGKTMLALNIAEHVALAGTGVLVFSLEMTADQLLERLIASLEQLDFQRLRAADLDESEWARVTRATTRLQKMPLFIDDTPALTPTELRARARRHKREHGLGLIVIDYLQLMRAPGAGENRNLEVTRISQSLKALAKELNVPVVALSQLNRSLQQRNNKRPRMSDLRDSGSIEQDADVIFMLYRDEVYNEDSPAKGIAEVIIGKQRNGPTGTVYLTFRGEVMRFENHAGPVPSAAPAAKKWQSGFDYEVVTNE